MKLVYARQHWKLRGRTGGFVGRNEYSDTMHIHRHERSSIAMGMLSPYYSRYFGETVCRKVPVPSDA
jgi:hypothetical protein